MPCKCKELRDRPDKSFSPSDRPGFQIKNFSVDLFYETEGFEFLGKEFESWRWHAAVFDIDEQRIDESGFFQDGFVDIFSADSRSEATRQAAAFIKEQLGE